MVGSPVGFAGVSSVSPWEEQVRASVVFHYLLSRRGGAPVASASPRGTGQSEGQTECGGLGVPWLATKWIMPWGDPGVAISAGPLR